MSRNCGLLRVVCSSTSSTSCRLTATYFCGQSSLTTGPIPSCTTEISALKAHSVTDLDPHRPIQHGDLWRAKVGAACAEQRFRTCWPCAGTAMQSHKGHAARDRWIPLSSCTRCTPGFVVTSMHDAAAQHPVKAGLVIDPPPQPYGHSHVPSSMLQLPESRCMEVHARWARAQQQGRARSWLLAHAAHDLLALLAPVQTPSAEAQVTHSSLLYAFTTSHLAPRSQARTPS